VPEISSSSFPKSLSESYVVERELARRDGIATFVARDVRDGRQVAISVVRPDVVRPPLIAAELGVLKSLQHPNLVRVLESGHGPARDGGGDVVYAVTPFVEGETLRQRLGRDRQLPLDEALRVTTAIGGALTYAHRHSIVHQGVSPDSIILAQGECFLTDYALAKWLLQPGARGEAIPPTSWLAYVSPEQATADKRIDAQTDQYSLACLLYEMLSGNPPFTGATPQVILTRMVSEPPPRLTSIRVVPRIVERAIDRALAKSPRDRFASVDAFVAALHGASARTPSMARTPVSAAPSISPSHSPSAEPRRRRWRVPLAAASVVLATAAGIALASRAVANRSPTAAAAHRQLTFTGTATAPVWSPDGRSVMYIVGGRSLVVQALDAAEPVTLIPSARAISAARWTSDGRAAVVAMARDTAERVATYVVPSRGGRARKVLDDARPFDTGLDSAAIVRAAREPGRLEVMDLVSGAVTRTISLPDSIGGIGDVSWSPDGRWVAFTGATDRRLWIVGSSGTGTPNRIADGVRNVRWAAESDALYFLTGRHGAVDLMRVPIDSASGQAAGRRSHVTSLLAADAFDVSATGRLVHTQATASAPALTFVLGGPIVRRSVEQHPVREGTGRVDGAVVSPDGRWVAYAATQGTERDIHVVAFGGGSPRVLVDAPAREHSPSWSADGSRLTFVRDDSSGRQLMIADARTGAAQRMGTVLGPGVGEVATTARWSASGRHIAYYANDLRRIALLNLQRRNESMVRVPDYVGRGHFAVLPSPNGTQLLATTVDSSDSSPLLWLIFSNGRRWRQIRGPSGETLPIAWHRNGWIYLVRDRGVATEHGAALVELWRMRGPTGRPELYATLPEGCGMSVSISADGSRGVCNYVRIESDLYVASSVGSISR
jgi:eukaryotic-like serine/threonine-protein kinase